MRSSPAPSDPRPSSPRSGRGEAVCGSFPFDALEVCPLLSVDPDAAPVLPVELCDPAVDPDPAPVVLEEPDWSVDPVLVCPLVVEEDEGELDCPVWLALLPAGAVEDWAEDPACVPLLPLELPPEPPVCALKLSASKSTGAAIHVFLMLYS